MSIISISGAGSVTGGGKSDSTNLGLIRIIRSVSQTISQAQSSVLSAAQSAQSTSVTGATPAGSTPTPKPTQADVNNFVSAQLSSAWVNIDITFNPPTWPSTTQAANDIVQQMTNLRNCITNISLAIASGNADDLKKAYQQTQSILNNLKTISSSELRVLIAQNQGNSTLVADLTNLQNDLNSLTAGITMGPYNPTTAISDLKKVTTWFTGLFQQGAGPLQHIVSDLQKYANDNNITLPTNWQAFASLPSEPGGNIAQNINNIIFGALINKLQSKIYNYQQQVNADASALNLLGPLAQGFSRFLLYNNKQLSNLNQTNFANQMRALFAFAANTGAGGLKSWHQFALSKINKLKALTKFDPKLRSMALSLSSKLNKLYSWIESEANVQKHPRITRTMSISYYPPGANTKKKKQMKPGDPGASVMLHESVIMNNFRKYFGNFKTAVINDGASAQNISNSSQAKLRLYMTYWQEFMQLAPQIMETYNQMGQKIVSHLTGGGG